MERIVLAFAVLAAGCYDPAPRDCTVSCQAAGDCVAGQVCGTDGFCAAPEIAGTCKSRGADAGRPPDAAGASLHVMVAGPGRITDTSGAIQCAMDCSFTVAPGRAITLNAVPNEDKQLDHWTTANCAGQDTSCTITVDAPVVTVGVKFH